MAPGRKFVNAVFAGALVIVLALFLGTLETAGHSGSSSNEKKYEGTPAPAAAPGTAGAGAGKEGRGEKNVNPFVRHISVVTNVGLTASNFLTAPRYRAQQQTT